MKTTSDGAMFQNVFISCSRIARYSSLYGCVLHPTTCCADCVWNYLMLQYFQPRRPLLSRFYHIKVLGRMRAASVGQNVRSSACRQARVKLDIEADAPVILIPESSHAERLLVANLGSILILYVHIGSNNKN